MSLVSSLRSIAETEVFLRAARIRAFRISSASNESVMFRVATVLRVARQQRDVNPSEQRPLNRAIFLGIEMLPVKEVTRMLGQRGLMTLLFISFAFSQGGESLIESKRKVILRETPPEKIWFFVTSPGKEIARVGAGERFRILDPRQNRDRLRRPVVGSRRDGGWEDQACLGILWSGRSRLAELHPS